MNPNDDTSGGGIYTKIAQSTPISLINDNMLFKVLDNPIYAYPNPIKLGEELSLLFFTESEVESIYLYNIKGQLVMQWDGDYGNYANIKIPNIIGSGLYLIGFPQDDKNSYKKITLLK